MTKRTSHEDAACPIARSLDAIGDWWSLLIVRDALLGVSRFGEFQRNLGLAKNILSARLKALVAHGVLEQTPTAGGGHQEYRLTAKGRALFPVLVALREWGEDHYFAPDEGRPCLVDREHGRPTKRLELRSEDGRLLGPADTLLLNAGESPALSRS
ncbi:helix-turn-helix domain-containing protein [Terrarubrum flagellatum]|uniref:winged helix-turn-helix transcriptional regulator n=1 Tax=Terrirubrum flagellatum TaxID=2895980 RepID=UPI0031453102